MKQHLDLTDDQIEASIIRLASASGVLDVDASTIRKKHRTRSVGDDESNVYYEYAEVEGQFSDTKTINDTLTVSYTIEFFKNGYGINCCTGCSATMKKKYNCGTEESPVWVEDPKTYKVESECTISLISGAIPKVEGSTCSLSVHYNLHVWYNKEFVVDEHITSAYSGAEATVTRVYTN